jgi:acyl carrier protein
MDFIFKGQLTAPANVVVRADNLAQALERVKKGAYDHANTDNYTGVFTWDGHYVAAALPTRHGFFTEEELTPVAIIFEQVRVIVAEQLCTLPPEVTLLTDIYKDMGADSLDALSLTLRLEEHFGIVMPNAEAKKITTVQQIVDFVATAKAKT